MLRRMGNAHAQSENWYVMRLAKQHQESVCVRVHPVGAIPGRPLRIGAAKCSIDQLFKSESYSSGGAS